MLQNMRMLLTSGVFLLVGVLFVIPAFAMQDAVSVISGGVGSESQMQMAQDKDHNLKLVFTGEQGMYLSDVGVTVADAQGNPVIHAVSDGPIMLINLAPGRYSIHAEAEGFETDQTVTVGMKQTTRQLRFPING